MTLKPKKTINKKQVGTLLSCGLAAMVNMRYVAVLWWCSTMKQYVMLLATENALLTDGTVRKQLTSEQDFAVAPVMISCPVSAEYTSLDTFYCGGSLLNYHRPPGRTWGESRSVEVVAILLPLPHVVMVAGRALSRLLSGRPKLGLINWVGDLTSPGTSPGTVVSVVSLLSTVVTDYTLCGHQIVLLLIRHPCITQ